MAARSLTLLLDMFCIVTTALAIFYVRSVFDPLQPTFTLQWAQLPRGPEVLDYLSLMGVYVVVLLLWMKNKGLLP